MKRLKFIILIALALPLTLLANADQPNFETSASFFPEDPSLLGHDITWGYLTVPQNWEKPDGQSIKLAVTLLKNTSNNTDPNPLVFLDGGPGDAGVTKLWYFLDDPIREKSDIILVDLRGTGFSEPKLCPDLGKKFFEILAGNQSFNEDEKQKVAAAIACKQDLINRNIDVKSYNSRSIANDLNSLKKTLGYTDWHVFGVSYGTQFAQVYAEQFPEDIKSLILDSSIPDVHKYYNANTSNYIGSLKKVFQSCEEDPNCREQFPDLEATYYATIAALTQNPITVKVDKSIIASGEFTYNAEDFKIAIQQALYNANLIEVLPLLITAFHTQNETTLGVLVSAFSGALGLDYGAYYCITCNEVLPYNSMAAYQQDAAKYDKLKGGLSFYKSDFLICEQWNKEESPILASTPEATEKPSVLTAPVLVFAGEFDPITPVYFGRATADKYPNSQLIEAPNYGHCPGASISGFKLINQFVNEPATPVEAKFHNTGNVDFAHGIAINAGVSKFASSLGEFNLLFFFPLLIAVLLLLVFCLVYLFSLFRKKQETSANKVMKVLVILSSICGLVALVGFVFAVNSTAADNFYILAFGLPTDYNYLFIFQWLFVGLIACSLFYFLLKMRAISNTSVVASVLFSGMLLSVYFYYWGFLV